MLAFLLDAEFSLWKGKSCVRLFLKGNGEKGRAFCLFHEFEPYFYLERTGSEEDKQRILETIALQRGREVKAKRLEECEKSFLGKPFKLWKVFCHHPGQVTALRGELKRFGKTFEYSIQYARRYLIDNKLVPNSLHEIEFDEKTKMVREIKPAESGEEPVFRTLAFDIESYSKEGLADPKKSECILISMAERKKGAIEGEVVSFAKKPFDFEAKKVASEKEMLEEFAGELRREHVDLLCTYNGDAFDLPFLRERARILKAKFDLGRKKGEVRAKQIGLRMQSRLSGRIHFDVFNAIAFLNTVGAIRLERLGLDDAYREFFKKGKVDLKKEDIWKHYDSSEPGEFRKLIDYSKTDSVACLELAEFLLPLQLELSRIVKLPLFDSSRMTTGQLVDHLLLTASFDSGVVSPSKPHENEIIQRQGNPIQGAFVKVPQPGLYEDIAVFDFRSLYPSIIVSHNISPETFDCNCCERKCDELHEVFVSPQGHKFCKKHKGLVAGELEKILVKRGELKKKLGELKKAGDDDSSEFKALDAQQQGYKILMNSFFGYLGYARARFYSRECAESITAFARFFIQDTMEKAEKHGFRVLYGDTDSVMLVGGSEEKALEFQKSVNAVLPKGMDLELEGFYPRGIFVGKKLQGKEKEKGKEGEADGREVGAKKKYALIDKRKKIKIRGFELVRRDWSKVARETQREVLKIILEEGDLEKAEAKVDSVVKELREGKIPLEKCVIVTQLQKSTRSYEVTSPELSAVQKARAAGKRVEEGAVISFVITRDGKSISDKAQIAELAESYDADYYVNNQVIPAVMKILGALGAREDDLKGRGKQKGLGDW